MLSYVRNSMTHSVWLNEDTLGGQELCEQYGYCEDPER